MRSRNRLFLENTFSSIRMTGGLRMTFGQIPSALLPVMLLPSMTYGRTAGRGVLTTTSRGRLTATTIALISGMAFIATCHSCPFSHIMSKCNVISSCHMLTGMLATGVPMDMRVNSCLLLQTNFKCVLLHGHRGHVISGTIILFS